MASIREIARYYIDDARDGIAWIAVWKSGRSWNAETFYPTDISEYDVPTWEEEDIESFREIVAVDPSAIIVNSYYHNLGDVEEMTVETLANAIRWQYEDAGKYLSDEFLKPFQ